MDAACESGVCTKGLQEEFSMRFDIPNFEVMESYEMRENGALQRRMTCNRKMSGVCFIGQSVNFPSQWCTILHPTEFHVGVGLKFLGFLKNGALVHSGPEYAFCKFRINIVDKDGFVVHARKWRSSEVARKISLGSDYCMADFVEMKDLIMDKEFFTPGKVLRLICEGVLYSNLEHTHFSETSGELNKYCNLPMTMSLWKRGMAFSDVELVSSEGNSVLAHKSVLSITGAVMWNLLNTVKNETKLPAKIYMTDMTTVELNKIVEFIYTGKFDQDWRHIDEVKELFRIAKVYELFPLKRLCAEMLGRILSMTTFSEMIEHFFPHLDDPTLASTFSRFLWENRRALINLEEFQEFAKRNKDAFLKVALYNGYSVTNTSNITWITLFKK